MANTWSHCSPCDSVCMFDLWKMPHSVCGSDALYCDLMAQGRTSLWWACVISVDPSHLHVFCFSRWIKTVCDSRSQICCLKGQRGLTNQANFDGIHIVNHYAGDDGSYQSSDEEGVKDAALEDARPRGGVRIRLRPNLRDTDSEEEEEEEDDEALRLSVPQSGSSKSTTVWTAPPGCQHRDCSSPLCWRRRSRSSVEVWITERGGGGTVSYLENDTHGLMCLLAGRGRCRPPNLQSQHREKRLCNKSFFLCCITHFIRRIFTFLWIL